MNKPRILNEGVYFGKTPTVKKLEAVCDDITKGKNFTAQRKNFERLEKIVKELVNCNDVYIEPAHTSMTFMTGFKITNYELIRVDGFTSVTTEDGIKFKNPRFKDMYIIISPGIFSLLTGEELCAILLHEIGHNMEISWTGKASALTVLLMAPFEVLKYAIIDRVAAAGLYLLNKLPALRSVITNIAGFIAAPAELFTTAMGITGSILPHNAQAILNNIITQPFNLLFNFFKFNAEKYADSYAAAFGYGKPLATALEKIKGEYAVREALNEIPLVKYYTGMVRFINDVLESAIGPHQSTVNRLATTTAYLKSCIANTENPRLKKELQKDLDEHLKLLNAWADGGVEDVYKQLAAKSVINIGKLRPVDWRQLLYDVISFGKNNSDKLYQGNLANYTKTKK